MAHSWGLRYGSVTVHAICVRSRLSAERRPWDDLKTMTKGDWLKLSRTDAWSLLIHKQLYNEITSKEYVAISELLREAQTSVGAQTAPRSVAPGGDIEGEVRNSPSDKAARDGALPGVTITQAAFVSALCGEQALSGPAPLASADTTHTNTLAGQSQKSRLWKLLLDGAWHTTPDIQRLVYGGEHLGTANIKARVYDINQELKEKGGQYEVISKRIIKSVWAYRLVKKEV